ncbi:MAG: GNAT family N-acetyltransferase [Firmicutes bacterium]|nr:GNAT family N-acetyltransferase [Bacillota bacterium]
MAESTIRIREANAEDIPAVIELSLKTVSESISSFRKISPSSLMENRKKDLLILYKILELPDIKVFIADDEEKHLAGYCIAMVNYIESTTGELQGWAFDRAIDKNFRRRGLGSALLSKADEFAKNSGMKYICGEIDSSNIPALEVSKNLGYVEERKKMLKVFSREPEILKAQSLFLVRRTVKEDIPKIKQLAVETVKFSISSLREKSIEECKEFRKKDLENLENLISFPNFGAFIAETGDGEFAGHCFIMSGAIDTSTGEKQAWIYDLAVVEEHRGKGAGKMLLLEAEKFAAETGMEYVGLSVTSENQSAVYFYESMGYLEERKQILKKL